MREEGLRPLIHRTGTSITYPQACRYSPPTCLPTADGVRNPPFRPPVSHLGACRTQGWLSTPSNVMRRAGSTVNILGAEVQRSGVRESEECASGRGREVCGVSERGCGVAQRSRECTCLANRSFAGADMDSGAEYLSGK